MRFDDCWSAVSRGALVSRIRASNAASWHVRGGVGFVVSVMVTACVNPLDHQAKKDFEDYLDRTESIRGKGGPDAAPPPPTLDASVPEGGGASEPSFRGDYLGICMAALSFRNLDRSLRFKAAVDYSKENASIAMTLTMLAIKSDNIGQPIGPSFSATSKVEGVVGKLDFGDTPDLPKEANSFTGVDFGINALKMATVFTAPPDKFCAHISGVTRPSGINIEGKGRDVCIFFKANGSDPIPLPPPEDFETTCPLPP